jgi:hypothetical protein
VPILRYFVFVGGILLAILFVVDGYIPKASGPFIGDEKIDKSIIRIHSAHRWPEKIVFDAQLATIAPSLVLSESPTVINQPREAFARLGGSAGF